MLAILAGGVYYLGKMSTQPLIFQSADKITLQEAKELVRTCTLKDGVSSKCNFRPTYAIE